MADAAPSSANLKKGGALAAAIGAIIGAVLLAEGGLADHRDDPGGRTKFGITEETFRLCGLRGEIDQLTRDQAVDCYRRLYVAKPGFEGIVEQSVALGEEVVDQGVNLGPRRPSCYLQTALNSLNRRQADYSDLAVDCVVGPATSAAFAALAGKRGNRKACELVLKLVDAQQGAEYLRLTQQVNPRLESFMAGWVDHRLGNVPLARCAKGGA